MITYGYAVGYMYTGDGTLQIQTRIPSVHGPMHESEGNGHIVRNYVQEVDLPYYPSLLLPHTPNYGDVVCLISNTDNNPDFIVIGLTGGNYGNMKLEQ